MSERVYTVVSDRYTQDAYQTTVEEFKQMCAQVFGEAPEIWEHLQDGHWVATDDKGEVVLSTNPKHTGK